MKKIVIIGLLAIGIALLGVWGWRVFFPNDEKLIHKLLDQVAETASFRANDNPLVKLGGASKLAGFFTEDAVIHLDVPGVDLRTISGRDELIQTAAAARATVQGIKVELMDIQLGVDAEGQTATAHLTAVGKVSGSSDPLVQELRMQLRKIDGKWRIAQVDPVRPRTL